MELVDILAALSVLAKQVNLMDNEQYFIIECSPKLYLHFVPLQSTFHPHELIKLQEDYDQQQKLLVHLWEDVWLLNQTSVLSRIRSFLGSNQTLYARNAKLIEAKSSLASEFFNAYHLQGFVRAKYYYGLVIDHELIAMAGFSDLRSMKFKGSHYTSAELIRFASKEGYTVTGGLSKMIKHFMNLKKPNDLMSYADRDWSLGKGYDKLGFELTTTTEPAYLFVDWKTSTRYFPHRLPKNILSAFAEQKKLNLDEYLAKNGFVKVFNTGNLKYHLYV